MHCHGLEILSHCGIGAGTGAAHRETEPPGCRPEGSLALYLHASGILPSKEVERCHELENDTVYLLNPGSIGQPRDHDPRAAYALFDSVTKTVYFLVRIFLIVMAQLIESVFSSFADS